MCPLPGLHHQLAVNALLSERDAFVDDILVAALEAEVAAAQPLDEVRQPVAGHAVCDNGRARVFPAGMEGAGTAVVCSAHRTACAASRDVAATPGSG